MTASMHEGNCAAWAMVRPGRLSRAPEHCRGACAIIDAGGDQRVLLKADRLAIIGGRDAHVADQHAENLRSRVPAHRSNPTGFTACSRAGLKGGDSPGLLVCGKHLMPLKKGLQSKPEISPRQHCGFRILLFAVVISWHPVLPSSTTHPGTAISIS